MNSFEQQLECRLQSGGDGIPELVDWLLSQAASQGASDLHLEPRQEELLIRLRLDGCLADAGRIKGPLRQNVVQRIKVLAGLLTYRTDIPQDGRISGSALAKVTDMRVSVYPAALGEKVVVRFFQLHSVHPAGQSEDRSLHSLGLDEKDAARLAGYLIRPQGMVLLTGPAGSGKTTTLYATLRQIVESSVAQRQIVTIEDPVERIIPGITHTELKPASGLDYPAALKAIMRQDPEVIMIGEIRDGETARVAVQAALTGHLILSTVHAPSAPEVLLRLLHLGIDPYLIASVVSLIVEQRLVRKLCACKQPAAESQGTFKPGSCGQCNGTGYKGRVLIADMLPMEGNVRTAVLERYDSLRLMNAAASVGWRGLWARGQEKAAAGLTSYPELRRVLSTEY